MLHITCQYYLAVEYLCSMLIVNALEEQPASCKAICSASACSSKYSCPDVHLSLLWEAQPNVLSQAHCIFGKRVCNVDSLPKQH